MRKFILVLATSGLIFSGLAVTSPAAYAETASKEETIGVGAGGIIGAFAGGPAGFILGAAIGAKLGDTLHGQDAEIQTLSASLDESRGVIDELESDVRELHSDIAASNAEIEKLQRVSAPELISLLQAGIAVDLLFRTDEHVLADTTGIRLNELARTLATISDIHVQLDGFADERGDEEYNQQLSEKRVQFVREQLTAAGIEDSRISYAAHGEVVAQDDELDSYALERRVSVKLYLDNSPSLASNPK